MEKILVIEDDNKILKILDLLLTTHGYSVTLAHDGVEGMELLDKETGFGLVITDIRMPKADGNEVAKYLKGKEEMLKTPVMAFSAHPEEAETDLFDLILEKPFRNKDLIGLIDSLI